MTSKTTTKLVSHDPYDPADSYPTVLVEFLDDVLVTKTDFVEFNFWTFLSNIGGSLGLWLGLGNTTTVGRALGGPTQSGRRR